MVNIKRVRGLPLTELLKRPMRGREASATGFYGAVTSSQLGFQPYSFLLLVFFFFGAERSTSQDSQPVTHIVLRICFATRVTFHHASPCEMLDGSSNVCIQRVVLLS